MSATECLDDISERLEAIRNQRLETIKNIQLLKSEYEHVTRLLEEAGVSPEGELEARRNVGKRKFCSNPKAGLEFLFENHILERNPPAVASFFVEEKRHLSKSAIGAYFGEISKEFNMQVLEEYLKLHEFRGLDFLQALRTFLLSFQLPGESQKIDKIVTYFAQEYVLQNPGSFRNSQDAYVLAYATILLNTTLHNANAKGHSNSLGDEKRFLQTLLEFDKDTNLPRDLVRSVYQGIKSNPIVLVEENCEPCIIRGWLWKLGGRVKIWKRRWFVLTEQHLFYYNAPERTTQRKGIVALENVSIRRASDRSREYCFELFPRQNGTTGATINTRKADREGVIITGRPPPTTPSPPSAHSSRLSLTGLGSRLDYHTTYRMAATNSEEYEKWVTSLQLITNRFGLAASAGGGVDRPLRGASVPCLPSSSRHNEPGLTSVASQPATSSNADA
uniref:Cytohesin-2 n=1 Tax=Mesocestoides corti TaxID=53468 RepID=A0A5K3FTP2_MESCO